MVMRAVATYITTPADTQVHDASVSTIDDSKVRHLKGAYAYGENGIIIGIGVQGNMSSTFDAGVAGNLRQQIPIELDVQPAIQMHVQLQDKAGALHTDFPIILFYTVDS